MVSVSFSFHIGDIPLARKTSFSVDCSATFYLPAQTALVKHLVGFSHPFCLRSSLHLRSHGLELVELRVIPGRLLDCQVFCLSSIRSLDAASAMDVGAAFIPALDDHSVLRHGLASFPRCVSASAHRLGQALLTRCCVSPLRSSAR